MRYILPTAALAAALALGAAPASAKRPQPGAEPTRSHVALHLSGHTVLSGNGVALHGRVRPAGARRVKLVMRGPETEVVWARTERDGSFALRWSPRRVGNYTARAYRAHSQHGRAAVSSARHLTSYRRADASYYGPGLYGNGVACGGTLMPGTLGVAHKTLPCGTKVKLRYHGHSVTVPVIDRGPYVAGRDYDLTEATKARLGFPGVGTVLVNR